MTTNGEPHADVFLDGAVVSDASRLHGNGAEMIDALYARALVGLCAIQLGVTERALRIAASYTTEREQFGRPIGSFQAVQQRMADAFIDVEAIRWTMWQAAWLLGQDRPPGREAAHREVLGGRGGRARRGDGSAGSRRNRHRHHLSPVPLLPVGQAQRADARFGVGAVGAPRRRLRERKEMTTDDHRTLLAPRRSTGTTSKSATRSRPSRSRSPQP